MARSTVYKSGDAVSTPGLLVRLSYGQSASVNLLALCLTHWVYFVQGMIND